MEVFTNQLKRKLIQEWKEENYRKESHKLIVKLLKLFFEEIEEAEDLTLKAFSSFLRNRELGKKFLQTLMREVPNGCTPYVVLIGKIRCRGFPNKELNLSSDWVTWQTAEGILMKERVVSGIIESFFSLYPINRGLAEYLSFLPEGTFGLNFKKKLERARRVVDPACGIGKAVEELRKLGKREAYGITLAHPLHINKPPWVTLGDPFLLLEKGMAELILDVFGFFNYGPTALALEKMIDALENGGMAYIVFNLKYPGNSLAVVEKLVKHSLSVKAFELKTTVEIGLDDVGVLLLEKG